MPDKALTSAEIAANRKLLTHVKSWLRFRDRTQRQLAEAVGMSEPAVSKWLRGTQAMTVAQFAQVATFLDADPTELLAAPPDRARAVRYRKIAEVAQASTPNTASSICTPTATWTRTITRPRTPTREAA